jgi:hypothetical protein
MKRLKEKWGIESNFQLAIIFIVFAITGSSAAKLAEPMMELIGLHRATLNAWIYWPLRILLIFPIYQVLLVAFGWLFGQFKFFWAFEKKMLKHMGIKL